jgi:hypothetical protein
MKEKPKPVRKPNVSICKDFIKEPKDEEDVFGLRDIISDSFDDFIDIDTGEIMDTSDEFLGNLFSEYDDRFLDNYILDSMEEDKISVNFNWVDSEVISKTTQDENKFTLEISNNALEKLNEDKTVVHIIKGVTCQNQFSCLQVYLEDFIVDILLYLCNDDTNRDELAKALFLHLPEIKKEEKLSETTSKIETVEKKEEEFSVEKIMELVRAAGTNPMVGFKDGSSGKVLSSRGKTLILEGGKKRDYEDIVSIDGTEITSLL